MKASRRFIAALSALALALALAGLIGCGSPTQTAGGTTDTGNSLDVLAGIVLGADNQPHANASLRLRRADYLSPLPAASKRSALSALSRIDTVSGPDGKFTLKNLDTAAFRLEAGDSTAAVVVDLDLRDLKKYPEDRIDLAALRLGKLTSVEGMVTLNPRSAIAYARVFGLERLDASDRYTGRFAVMLPAGTHRLQLLDPDCAKCVKTVDLMVAGEDTLELGVVDLRDSLPADTVAPYAAWAHGARLTVNTTPGGADVSGDVTRFPLLVRLDSGNFDFAKAKADGRDLRFSDSSGTRALPYEIERWDSAGRRAEVWVRLDQVKGNDATQHFRMHWGQDTAASASSGAAVFDTGTGHAGVWHLAEKGGTLEGGFKDATSRGQHGTGTALADSNHIDGAVGGAQRFDGIASAIRVPDADALDFGTGDFTVSAWVRSDGLGGKQQILCKRTSPGADYEIQMLPDGKLEGHVGPDPTVHILTGTNTLAAIRWHLVVLQRRGDALTLFLDSEPTGSSTDGPRNVDNDGDLWFGRDFADALQERWKGGLDEVRLQRAAATRDWIKLSFRTQQPGAKVLSFAPIK